jgi:hypothetical protein
LPLQADENNAPKRGGSNRERKKSKPRQRMEEHVMLYTKYFANDSTYTPKGFLQVI